VLWQQKEKIRKARDKKFKWQENKKLLVSEPL